MIFLGLQKEVSFFKMILKVYSLRVKICLKLTFFKVNLELKNVHYLKIMKIFKSWKMRIKNTRSKRLIYKIHRMETKSANKFSKRRRGQFKNKNK